MISFDDLVFTDFFDQSIIQGPVGPPGEKGNKGDKGDQGEQGDY